MNWIYIFALLAALSHLTMGANVVIFQFFTKGLLLGATRLASILHEAGHRVTIVIHENDIPDIKASPNYDFLTYKTDMSRDEEQEVTVIQNLLKSGR